MKIYILLCFLIVYCHSFVHVPTPNWSNGTAQGYVLHEKKYLDVAEAYAYGCNATSVIVNGIAQANGQDRSQYVVISTCDPITVLIHIWCGEGMLNNTIQNPYSTGKAWAYTDFIKEVSDGTFKNNEKISKKSPEFRLNGKNDITYADLTANRAGLQECNVFLIQDTDVGLNESQVFQAMANSTPYNGKVRKINCNSNNPRCFTYNTTYNPVNKVWWMDLAVRRATGGTTIEQSFLGKVVRPMGDPNLEFYLGIAPDNVAIQARTAPITPGVFQPIGDQSMGAIEYLIALADNSTPQWRSAYNPRYLLETGPFYPDTVQGRNTQFGSGGWYTNAWSGAMIYTLLARGGEINGIRIMSQESIEKATREVFYGLDYQQHVVLSFTEGGFVKNFPTYTNAPNTRTFGHPGLAGSNCFADPVNHIASCYITSVFNSGNMYYWLPFNAWNPNYVLYNGMGYDLNTYVR